MGAERRSRTFHMTDNSSSLWMASNVPWAKNLTKNQLGGVIFGCTNSTMGECHHKQLFGLPAQHFSYVQNIEPGLPLFLFNYSDRKLHGIYEAASSGKLCIDSYAWTEKGSGRTKFPAQVQILVRLKCEPLSEREFKPIIIDNYYGQSHFWFVLDHTQANRLISKLSSVAIASRPSVHRNIPKVASATQRFPLDYKNEANGCPEPPSVSDDFDKSYDSIRTSSASDDSLCLNGNNQSVDTSLCKQMAELQEKDLIYMKLKELDLSRKSSDANMTGRTLKSALEDEVDLESHANDDAVVNLRSTSNGTFADEIDYIFPINQLCHEIEELKTFKQEQTTKMLSLEKKLAEAEQKIHQLQSRCMILESLHNSSTTLATDEKLLESPDDFHINLKESIFLVGGYDGASWSSALHSFSPSRDTLKTLKPMSSVRSYASVAKLDGELYVFGGGTGSTWYDTVESYNAANNQWTIRPSLNKQKGSLSGGALNGKLFAVGGGNGVDCFADVEMYDPDIGRWIPVRSMLQKRFALAAVELNGSLYAVGGFDGNDYLKSAERFDPREHSWTRIESMNTKRGCHALVSLNGKLYAIGGYDGMTMVPTVEIYDPRLGTWIEGPSMHQARGYSAAAVLQESIYVIGGVKANDDIVDMVECYKDSQGWEETKLGAVGKRCFASAIVLEED